MYICTRVNLSLKTIHGECPVYAHTSNGESNGESCYGCMYLLNKPDLTEAEGKKYHVPEELLPNYKKYSEEEFMRDHPEFLEIV